MISFRSLPDRWYPYYNRGLTSMSFPKSIPLYSFLLFWAWLTIHDRFIMLAKYILSNQRKNMKAYSVLCGPNCNESHGKTTQSPFSSAAVTNAITDFGDLIACNRRIHCNTDLQVILGRWCLAGRSEDARVNYFLLDTCLSYVGIHHAQVQRGSQCGSCWSRPYPLWSRWLHLTFVQYTRGRIVYFYVIYNVLHFLVGLVARDSGTYISSALLFSETSIFVL